MWPILWALRGVENSWLLSNRLKPSHWVETFFLGDNSSWRTYLEAVFDLILDSSIFSWLLSLESSYSTSGLISIFLCFFLSLSLSPTSTLGLILSLLYEVFATGATKLLFWEGLSSEFMAVLLSCWSCSLSPFSCASGCRVIGCWFCLRSDYISCLNWMLELLILRMGGDSLTWDSI